mmetsp:Transcript_20052/g.17771  ORF Transcript_20052/g.17771 Transcript_20052/m.17771 type:complete len:104 (-) Transcript_20052:280-591(-)
MSYEISIIEEENSHSNTLKQQPSQNNKMLQYKMDSRSDKADGKKASVSSRMNYHSHNWFGRWYSLWRYGYPLNMETIKNDKPKPVYIPTIQYWNYQWQIEDWA